MARITAASLKLKTKTRPGGKLISICEWENGRGGLRPMSWGTEDSSYKFLTRIYRFLTAEQRNLHVNNKVSIY